MPTSTSTCYSCHSSQQQSPRHSTHQKRIFTSPSQSTNFPPGTSSPNLTFTSTWLCINITIAVTHVNHPSKDILLAFHNLTLASWLIDPFLSFLPVFQTSNFPPITQESDNFKSVYNLIHYLKNSSIATLSQA